MFIVSVWFLYFDVHSKKLVAPKQCPLVLRLGTSCGSFPSQECLILERLWKYARWAKAHKSHRLISLWYFLHIFLFIGINILGTENFHRMLPAAGLRGGLVDHPFWCPLEKAPCPPDYWQWAPRKRKQLQQQLYTTESNGICPIGPILIMTAFWSSISSLLHTLNMLTGCLTFFLIFFFFFFSFYLFFLFFFFFFFFWKFAWTKNYPSLLKMWSRVDKMTASDIQLKIA